jgi:hypothetical protein
MTLTTLLKVGAVAIVACATVACATGPTMEQATAAIARAEASVESAETAGAREFGGAELYLAREKLARAQLKAEKGKLDTATRFAEQATVDADLAIAEGQTGQSRETLEQLRDGTEALRQELERQHPTQQQFSTVRP